MEMALLNDGRVLFIERKGALKQYDPNTGLVKTLATIPVNTKYTNKKGQIVYVTETMVKGKAKTISTSEHLNEFVEGKGKRQIKLKGRKE